MQSCVILLTLVPTRAKVVTANLPTALIHVSRYIGKLTRRGRRSSAIREIRIVRKLTLSYVNRSPAYRFRSKPPIMIILSGNQWMKSSSLSLFAYFPQFISTTYDCEASSFVHCCGRYGVRFPKHLSRVLRQYTYVYQRGARAWVLLQILARPTCLLRSILDRRNQNDNVF